MPYREDDPFPEHLEIEVYSLLAGLVHLWILVAVLIVDILFEGVSKEAGPRGP